jgi:stage III sporulation protein AA
VQYRLKSIISNYLPECIAKNFNDINAETFEKATEIRLRAEKPILIKAGIEIFLPYVVSCRDIAQTLELMSGYSLYAIEDELSRGYMTLPGGHRVGITGRAVTENGAIKTLKNISALNLRISHEIIGCCREIESLVAKPSAYHTMIISPPGCGKTTLLRDIVRVLSESGFNVAVADERSEIAGCYMGLAQNNLGNRTDVLDACPKAEGIMMLLRAMSPQVIAADEIGRENDIRAIEEVLCAGVKVLCTVHASSLDEVTGKPVLGELIKKNIFERYVVVSARCGPGTIEAVYGKNREILYGG